MSPSEPLSRNAALAYLLARIDYERVPRFPYQVETLKLERMRQLLSGLGDPHQRYPIVHVAGTKGKGSTSAMLASILSAAGYRTGLYTSPHLERIEERMTIDGNACSGTEFAALIEDIRRVVDVMEERADGNGNDPEVCTYFEITTAAAMLHFARRGVDAAVLEVGLGGRLDATNVCQPAVAVITSISYDHMRQLGNTLAAIAGEKAGILKPGVPVVSGVVDREAAEVIRQRARQHACTCHELGRDFEIDYRGLCYERPSARPTEPARLVTCFDYRESGPQGETRYASLQLHLLGRHQAANAAVAIATAHRLRALEWEIPESAIRQGLEQAYVPARTELVGSQPAVVVDAGHNVASVQALVDVLEEAFPAARRRVLVFATSRDKDLEGMLGVLLPRFETVILTRYLNNPRYVDPAELRTLAEAIAAASQGINCTIEVQPDPPAAWSAARALAGADDLICVTGSFFLAAEIRALANVGPIAAHAYPANAVS